jgi:hypothetical protein
MAHVQSQFLTQPDILAHKNNRTVAQHEDGSSILLKMELQSLPATLPLSGYRR